MSDDLLGSRERFDDQRGPEDDEKSFASYRRLILYELKRQNKEIENNDDRIQSLKDNEIARLREELTILKVKAAMWGALGGSIGGIIIAVVTALIVSSIAS
jgi:hypothetical protein